MLAAVNNATLSSNELPAADSELDAFSIPSEICSTEIGKLFKKLQSCNYYYNIVTRRAGLSAYLSRLFGLYVSSDCTFTLLLKSRGWAKVSMLPLIPGQSLGIKLYFLIHFLFYLY